MHSDLKSAQQSAEKLRAQGTVIYIAELPGIMFTSASGYIVVTEINSRCPLAGYSITAVVQEALVGHKMKHARDCYFEVGAPMLGVALSFNHNSRFWRQSPSSQNSMIVVGSNNLETPPALLTSRKLVRRHSYSNGSAYLLGWRTIPDRADDVICEHALGIVAKADMRLGSAMQGNA